MKYGLEVKKQKQKKNLLSSRRELGAFEMQLLNLVKL